MGFGAPCAGKEFLLSIVEKIIELGLLEACSTPETPASATTRQIPLSLTTQYNMSFRGGAPRGRGGFGGGRGGGGFGGTHFRNPIQSVDEKLTANVQAVVEVVVATDSVISVLLLKFSRWASSYMLARARLFARA